MTVLDASGVLALIHNEPGSDIVAAEIVGAVLGAANLAEVVGKLVDAEIDVARVRELLSAAGVIVEAAQCRGCRTGRRTTLPRRWPGIVFGRPLLPGAHRSKRPCRGADRRSSMGRD